MYTVKHTRIIDNYIELLKAGLDKINATIIARRLAAKVILDIAVSDLGIHMNIWDNEAKSEVTCVFKFTA